jgi:hypothetical protein
MSLSPPDGNDLNWEALTQLRKIARICAVFKAYTGKWAWKAISDRLQKPYYLSRVDHDRKIEAENKRHVEKYYFLNRTLQLWNQLTSRCFRDS